MWLLFLHPDDKVVYISGGLIVLVIHYVVLVRVHQQWGMKMLLCTKGS